MVSGIFHSLIHHFFPLEMCFSGPWEGFIATNVHEGNTALLNSRPALCAPSSQLSAKSPQLQVTRRLLTVGKNECQLQFSGTSQ